MLPPSYCVVQCSTFGKPSSSACGGCYLLLSSRVSWRFLDGVPDYGQALVRNYSSPSKCSEILFIFIFREFFDTSEVGRNNSSTHSLHSGKLSYFGDNHWPTRSSIQPLVTEALYACYLHYCFFISDRYIQTLLSSSSS